MINHLINNKGGLHNRVTLRLKINPFTLSECEEFLQSKDIQLNRYQFTELYMVMGGIPFYLEHIEKGLSATQIIQNLCFEENGILKTEFTIVFKSLFKNGGEHEKLIEVIAKKLKGVSREEIYKDALRKNGGGVTRMLKELEESGFIRKYVPIGKKIKRLHLPIN